MLGNGMSHGMYNPATVWSSDTSMYFDGVNDMATYSLGTGHNVHDHFSASMWVRAGEINTDFSLFQIRIGHSTKSTKRLKVWYRPGTQRLHVTRVGIGGTTTITKGVALSQMQQGIHVCLAMENSEEIVLYVDGQAGSLVDTNSGNWEENQTLATHINIGASEEQALGEYFNGWIRDVTFFSGQIGGEQVADIYNSAEPKDQSGSAALLHNWTSNNQYQGLLEHTAPPLIVSNYATS